MSTLKTDAIETRAGGTSVLTIGTATQTIKLPGGTPGAGKYLQSDADGDASWATVAGFDSIALLSTQNASSSTSINFDNTLITSTYKTYEIRFFNINSSGDNDKLQMKFSDDNGSNFDSNHTGTFDSAYAGTSGAGSGYDTNADSVAADHQNIVKNTSNDAGHSMGGVVWIHNPTNASYVTTYNFLTSNITYEAGYLNSVSYSGGIWNSTAAVDYIRMTMSSGTLVAGTFQLWGYK